MNMNFQLAFEKLGVDRENRYTIFRYDDTNPEAESKEYIANLREDVEWMGHVPSAITFTSGQSARRADSQAGSQAGSGCECV